MTPDWNIYRSDSSSSTDCDRRISPLPRIATNTLPSKTANTMPMKKHVLLGPAARSKRVTVQKSLVNNHEKLLRRLDWVDKHKLWSEMSSLRGFRKLLIRLEKRFSPGELLRGEKTGRRTKGLIKLHEKVRVPPEAPQMLELPGVADQMTELHDMPNVKQAAGVQLTLLLFGFKPFVHNVSKM